MALQIKSVHYYYTCVKDRPGEGYKLLSELAAREVNQLAFCAVPMGPDTIQLTLFPEHVERFVEVSEKLGLTLDGPHTALLVQGDDSLGALADMHAKLYKAGVNIFASSGVTDGSGSYGYVLYVRPDKVHLAAEALGV